LVAFAVEQDAPIPRYPFFAGMLAADTRSAIGRDGIIPTRFVPQRIEGTHIFEEPLTHSIWRSRQAVKIYVLIAIIRAQANHITLVRDQVDECILPVKAADSGITLADGLARLD